MAVVRVCDICGRKLTAIQYEIERNGFINMTLDVCPACMKKMTEWIKAKTNDTPTVDTPTESEDE